MYIRKRVRPPNSSRQHTARYQRCILALTLALITLLGAAFYQMPRAHAAGSGPIIHWDSSMIFAGQNNGNPWGPVGETSVVHGEGFTAGQQVNLVVVPGNINTSPALCQPPSPGASVVVAQATADSSGTFSAGFAWPAGIGAAGHMRDNSICALNASDNSVVSSRDDGPFTVLADNEPAFTVSTTSVAAGSTLTVSGQNWVPPQPVSIAIGTCADCGNPTVVTASANSAGLNSGTFSVNISIPANATPGNYIVNVFTPHGPLDAYHISGSGIKDLAITAAVATPTSTVTPTAVATQTAGATPTSATANSGNSGFSGGGNSGLLVIVLIAIIVVVLAIGGLLFFLFMQRKNQGSGSPALPSGPTSTPPGQPAGQQLNQYGSPTPFPSGPPMNAQGQFGSSPNNAFPGFNQSWQGNQQVNAGFNNFNQSQPFPQSQGNFTPGMTAAPVYRNCVRCGSPLAPNTTICGSCGTHNMLVSDPNGPTMAY